MVAHDRKFATTHHDIQTLAWIGPVTHHITQTGDLIDALGRDVGHDSRQRFQISVYITDQSLPHGLWLLISKFKRIENLLSWLRFHFSMQNGGSRNHRSRYL
jgi:hypothetical protein